MKFEFPINYQVWPHNRYCKVNFYLGIKFYLDITIDGEDVGLYLHVNDFPPGKDKIHLKYSLGILNQNGNVCRKKTAEKEFLKSDLPQTWGYRKWLKMNQIHPYVVNNVLTFCVTIDESSFGFEHSNYLLTQIHQSLCSDRTKVFNEALAQENRTLYETNNALETEIQELRVKLESTNEMKDVQNVQDVDVKNTPSKKQKIQEKTPIEVINGIAFDDYNLQELLKLSSSLVDTNARLQQYLQESATCCICMENQIDSIFTCGHRICSDCARKVQECPVCKKPIDKVIKIF